MLKKLFLYLLTFLFVISVNSQNVENNIATPDSTKRILLVEAACGQCQFQLPGKECSLAIRIKGKIYFVDGTTIDDHGDAHASDGFCSVIRKAEIQGEVVKRRFKVSYFKLIIPEIQAGKQENAVH